MSLIKGLTFLRLRLPVCLHSLLRLSQRVLSCAEDANRRAPSAAAVARRPASSGRAVVLGMVALHFYWRIDDLGRVAVLADGAGLA